VRVGIFDGIGAADSAIVRLRQAGFSWPQITVVASKSTCGHFERERVRATEPAGSRLLLGAATGGIAGAVLGGILAAAVVVGTGGAALVIAGPLAAGLGAGAATGSFIGAMMSRGFEEETARFYDQALKPGKILVGVDYEGPNQRARLVVADQILNQAGAEPLALANG
jgi:hypothetical protein